MKPEFRPLNSAASPAERRPISAGLSVALLLGFVAAPAVAQSTIRVSAGITAGTDLVDDVVFSRDVQVSQAAAPTLAIAYRMGASSGIRIGAEGRFSKGRVETTDRFGTREGPSFVSASIMAAVDGPVLSALRWDATAGVIKYLPSSHIEILREGGPAYWVVGAGLSWLQPIGDRNALVIGARYDLHPFITRAMQSHGFSGDQRVQRVGITAGLERTL